MFKDLRKPVFYAALTEAFVLGVLIWALSPLMTGHKEAFDGGNGYYFLALMIAGFIPAFIHPKYFWSCPLMVLIGQESYILATNGLNGLMTVVFLVFYARHCIEAAVFGAIVSKIGHEIISMGSTPAVPESQHQSYRAMYRGIFIALSVTVFVATVTILGWGFIGLKRLAASSVQQFPFWINVANVLHYLIFVSPFVLLAVESLKWSHRGQVFTRQQFLCKVSAWASVLLLYLAYRSFPYKNTHVSIVYLVSIPFVPRMLSGIYTLYSKMYVEKVSVDGTGSN